MNINTLIIFSKEKYPERLIEICEAIDLLSDSLTNLKSDIGKAMPDLNENNDWNSLDEYKNYSKEISNIISKITEISNQITMEDSFELDTDSEHIELSDKTINYNDKIFNVDSKVPHTLYEDFTYTRPAAIKIEDKYLEANKWQDILNQCCQYLYKKDCGTFVQFLNDDTMTGRTCKYFSYNQNELREGRIISGTNIYVESNVSAMFVRNIIIKMLEKYEIPKRKCHIFIRRDFTSIHNTNEELNKAEQNIINENTEFKIGQYAKEYFLSYFKANTSKDTILKFMDKNWCHDTFGICYPILKEINPLMPIGEQVNYNNEYRRYYVNPVLSVSNKSYIICSQWYPQFKSKLIQWINGTAKKSINRDSNFVKFGKEYSSIKLPKTLYVHILKAIEQYQFDQFETGKLSENLSDLICKQTNYEKAHHVINNVRKYLEDNNIVSLCEHCKKGKYRILDVDKLQQLIHDNTHANIDPNNKNVITYNCKVVLYSYSDKKQITVQVGNLNDEYVYLHDECVGKKQGYRFCFMDKEYVIVTFKNNK